MEMNINGYYKEYIAVENLTWPAAQCSGSLLFNPAKTEWERRRKCGSEKNQGLRQEQVNQRMAKNKTKGIHLPPLTNRLIVIASP